MTSNDGANDTGAANDDGGDGAGGDPSGQPNVQGGENGGEGGGENEVRDPEAVLKNNAVLTDQLKSARAKLTEFEADAEKRRVAALSEQEKAIEAARKEAAAEVRAEMEGQIARERIRAHAAGVLIDPDDAVLHISIDDLDDYEGETIDAAIAELAKAKPHLAGKGAGKRNVNQGPQGGAPSGDNPNDWIRRQIGR